MQAGVPTLNIREKDSPTLHRTIAASVSRHVSVARSSARKERLELDSHADTCVAGSNCLYISSTGRSVTVSGFSSELAPISNIDVATVATAYTSPENGRTIILIINECLYFGDRMGHSLLNPNQLRNYGVLVRDVPLQFRESSTHSIYLPGPSLDLPLELEGVISFLETRRPTRQEMEECQHITLTSDEPWEPGAERFATAEAVARQRGPVVEPTIERRVPVRRKTRFTTVSGLSTCPRMPCPSHSDAGTRWHENEIRVIAAMTTIDNQRTLYDSNLYDQDDLAARLISCVHISSEDLVGDGIDGWNNELLFPETAEQRRVEAAATLAVVNTDGADMEVGVDMKFAKRTSVLSPAVLARRWGIGLEVAQRTLEVTTQLGVRTVIHPLERRFRTKQSHLKFPSYRAKVYTDPIFASVKSIRGYTCGQVFVAPPAYLHFYPMKSKADVSLALMQNIHDVGIMSDLISDGAKEEVSGKMLDVTRQHHIRTGRTEPYSQWQNRAEGEIRELKKAALRQQRSSGSPQRLWCYLMEYVAATRRLTAWNNPTLKGRTAAEIIEGNTGADECRPRCELC